MKTLKELIDDRDKAQSDLRDAVRLKCELELKVDMLTRAIIAKAKQDLCFKDTIGIAKECGVVL